MSISGQIPWTGKKRQLTARSEADCCLTIASERPNMPASKRKRRPAPAQPRANRVKSPSPQNSLINEDEQLIPAPMFRQMLGGISEMTEHRYLNDPAYADLKFPKPMRIR